MKKAAWVGAMGLAAALCTVPDRADAFCGFYVSGADAKLFNNATMVVLMRDGTRTVLSMQNNYEGPPEDFAMVVPVPVVLQEDNVKTLPREIFARVDQLAAPRLVEYWEQDPCEEHFADKARRSAMPAPMAAAAESKADAGYGVKIEAQFTVGEYEIVILSAKDSTGLDAWLRDNKYKIPDGAEPVLRPYVDQGMKFFVAKVNSEKVKFEKRDGKDMALLSPLRFHYDDDKFSLPVRLGLLNSGGTQDLIVHILAPAKRYEVANYPNVTIPTNLDVDEKARGEFGAFYAALFDKTLEENPRAVITEYSWDAGTCDPCPSPALNPSEIQTLGGDALATDDPNRPRIPQVQIRPDPKNPQAQRHAWQLQGQLQQCFSRALEGDPKAEGEVTIKLETNDRGDVVSSKLTGGEKLPPAMLTCARGAVDSARFAGAGKLSLSIPVSFRSIPQPPPFNFVLTRLHARYGKESLGEDLVFREAKPIFGGREVRDGKGKLETGGKTQDGGMNNFQGRYAIRHPWTGEIKCKNPVRGVWGGPPAGQQNKGAVPALDLAFAPRGKTQLASFLRQDVPEIKLSGLGPAMNDPESLAKGGTPKPTQKDEPKKPESASKPATEGGCSCEVGAGATPGRFGWLGLALAAALGVRRRRASAR